MLTDQEKNLLLDTAKTVLINRPGMFERFKQDVDMKRHDWFFNALDIAEFKIICGLSRTSVLHMYAPELAEKESANAAAKLVAKWARHQPAAYAPKALPPTTRPDAAPVIATIIQPEQKPAKAKRRTWIDVAGPYITGVMQSGQYADAKQLFNALERLADSEGSPFDRGVAHNRWKLFLRETSKSLSLKTVQNNWQKLLDAAANK